MIEVMKQALEALETPKPLDDYPPILNAYAKTINNAIASLRQAIADLESQKPLCTASMFDDWFLAKSGLDPKTPLYTHPPQRKEQNFCSRCGKRTPDLTHIHTCTPPQD
jgi:hypothetical protein